MWSGSNAGLCWHGPLYMGGVSYAVPTVLEFELDKRYLQNEREILVEALENWVSLLGVMIWDQSVVPYL